jgi:hypothetical protein
MTYHVRRAILSRATSLVDNALLDTFNLTSRAVTDAKNIKSFSLEDVELRGWSGEWKGEFFTDMWELREELELMAYQLEKNLRTIRRIHEIELKLIPAGKSSEAKNYEVESSLDDIWEWENLEHIKDYTFKMLERTREAYVDAVQATAAQFANDQAKRSVISEGPATN